MAAPLDFPSFSRPGQARVAAAPLDYLGMRSGRR
jgi:hypothetical protein